MALRRRGFVSVGAVVACCALAAACSPDQAPVSTPSPTPAATTPAESQIERQMRLDYEAAEEAYRATCRAGPAVSRQVAPSRRLPALKQPRPAPIYGSVVKSLRDVHETGWRATAGTTESWASCETVAGRSERVGLTSCEDNERRQIRGRIGQGRHSCRDMRRMCRHLTVVRKSAVVGRSRRP